MARYTVHTPKAAATREGALERAILVPDGWSWGAFLFGPLWLLWNRHWVMGILVLVAEGAVLAGLAALPMPENAGAAAHLLMSLLFGLEGSTLRRFALAKAGYAEVALVAGPTLESAEHRFFDALDLAPKPRASVSLPGLNPAGLKPAGVIGLFPAPRQP